MSARETTHTLLERLRRHYIKPGDRMPGGVFVPECGINGGAQTRADALYVGFTSTSGRLLVGHEIKVSRADWRKELDTAGKADFWADNCHEWYIVAPSVEIVPPEELPHGWGLMIPSARSANRMEIKVRAATWPDRQPEWKAVRSILARLDTLQAQQMAAFEQRAREEATADADRRFRQWEENADRAQLTPEIQRRLNSLDRLENLLGERLTDWFDRTDGVTPEVAVAALRLAEAREQLIGDRRDRFSHDRLRDSAQAVLSGLDEFTAALADLHALGNGR